MLEKVFLQLRDAYDTLLDTNKRRAYDEKLLHPKRKTLSESLAEELSESLKSSIDISFCIYGSEQEPAPAKRQKQFLSEVIAQTMERGNKKADLELQMKDPDIIKLRISWNSKKSMTSISPILIIRRLHYREAHRDFSNVWRNSSHRIAIQK